MWSFWNRNRGYGQKILIFEKVRDTNQNGSDTEPSRSVNLLIISIYITLLRGQVGPPLKPFVMRGFLFSKSSLKVYISLTLSMLTRIFILLALFYVSSQPLFSQDIDEALNEISKEMNKSLPMVIDEYTTLLTTYGGKGKVLYRYALNTEIFSDYNISKDRWIEAQNKSIKNTFCTSPDMSFYRRYNVTVSWNYVDLEGRFITKIELNQKDCQ